ncbi:hypothetical protein SHKM778_17990 [Streptomyces sp. KM77-8]|uniref:Uncharacterized protein n=1 Tax=Streptomyces haneummycinicus TaxID=3074435 RepID=A0AAT9HDN0_9ACTN
MTSRTPLIPAPSQFAHGLRTARNLRVGGQRLPRRLRPRELLPDLRPYDAQLADQGVQLVQLAPVDLERGGARVALGMPGAQTLHEGPGLLEAEPEVLERADLPQQLQIALVVRPVSVAGAPGRQQPQRFVVPQRARGRPGACGQLADSHTDERKP